MVREISEQEVNFYLPEEEVDRPCLKLKTRSSNAFFKPMGATVKEPAKRSDSISSLIGNTEPFDPFMYIYTCS